VSVVQYSAIATSSAASTCSQTLTGVTAGNYVRCLLGYSDSSGNTSLPSGVSDGTNNFTKDISQSTTSHQSASIWTQLESAGGTITVTATKGSSAVANESSFEMLLVEVTPDTVDVSASTQGTSTTGVTDNITPGNVNDIIFGFAFINGQITSGLITPTNWTELGIESGAVAMNGSWAYYAPGSTAEQSPEFASTLSAAQHWAVVLVAYTPNFTPISITPSVGAISIGDQNATSVRGTVITPLVA
jgi:hypothetical protein